MPTVPLCCGVEPHCAQKGLLDAGGGPEIFIPPDEPPPHPVIESIIPSNANPASRWGVIKRGRVDIAGLQILVALGDAGFSIFATSRGVYHREERTETRRKCVNSPFTIRGYTYPTCPAKPPHRAPRSKSLVHLIPPRQCLFRIWERARKLPGKAPNRSTI